MVARSLGETILDGGIRSVNFFNGRLLSGEDLTQEYAANTEARRRLGLAIGEGIAFGLEVEEAVKISNKTAPVVTIRAGLAINRQGQTLALAQDIDVSLVRPGDPTAGTSSQTLFSTCSPPQTGPYIAGMGVYLLTIAPATGSEGRAPVTGLGNIPASCNTRSLVEGLQFHLLQVDLPLNVLQDSDHLRNTLAFSCFGTSDSLVSIFNNNPLSSVLQGGYGLLDTMRKGSGAQAGCLTDDEVPLALLYWTVDSGIKFIDLWSVRRRITQPPADTRWAFYMGDRRRSECEAMFLQLEDQVQDISTNEVGVMASLAATQRFNYLPPAGILPIAGGGSLTGFDPFAFFGSLASRQVEMTDGNLVRSLLCEALHHEPINLLDTGRFNRIQLYSIWENVQSVIRQETDQLVLVFASHTLPYRGVARFGHASFNISRFAPFVR